ncbi:MAG TPA: 50S ribosomal protein L11 methyltransferase [Chthoniobacterales bacterium]
MILWQKQASPAWLAQHEAQLEEIAGRHLALIARPDRARTLVQVTCASAASSDDLLRRFGGVTKTLPRDWWKTQRPPVHSPIRVGPHLRIVNAASRLPNEREELVIPAAGAFGTGEHLTTAMSLRLLEEVTRKLSHGWRLVDAGTGTGILALAARRLGAGEVLGFDNDPRAVAHARQNARLNQIVRARFEVADVLRWKPPARYDVVTANLFSELLIAALPTFRRALVSGGRLITSGILREQAANVIGALSTSHFQVEKVRRRGKWIALLASRKS